MRETEQPTLSLSDYALAQAAGAPDRLIRAARLWALVVVVLVVLNLALVVWYVVRTGYTSTFFTHQMLIPFLAIIYTRLGSVIIARRPRNPIGWIFLGVGTLNVLTGLAAGVGTYGIVFPPSVRLALNDPAQWLGTWVWLPAQVLPITFVFLLFPDGRWPSPRWRPIGWAAGLGLLLLTLGLAAHPGPVPDWGTRSNPYGIAGTERVLNVALDIGSALLVVGALGCILSIVARFRRSRGIERAQMKWLMWAALVVLALSTFTVPLWLSGNLAQGLALELSIILTSLMTLGIAMTATVAIMRYRLYDIDVLINRTLVYALMTGAILLIYGLIVGAAGVLFQSQGSWLLGLVATGLVAVLFQPIRQRLQRGVNRLLYGQRDEPFEVLAHLGQRLEQTMTPDTVYPTIVETIAHALRLPYVALQVREDGRGGFQTRPHDTTDVPGRGGFETRPYNTVESYGRPVDEPVAFPLVHQGEMVGRLLVGRRGSEEAFSVKDERLLENIVRQAGAAVYNAQLTLDLQRSRQQIVSGREEERRRLRRDLHDGLGPSLASLLLEARVLRRMIRDDPAEAERLADEMQGDIRATIDDIRRVVHELRPPALDDLGLVPALNVLAAKIGRNENATPEATGLQVHVDAPDDLPPLPAAVEVAAYRIIQEALTNVVHHADARCATVRLRLDHALHIEVADDGAGFKEGRAGGLGLRSMRERAAELGGSFSVTGRPAGGTVVRAALPVGEA
ncbi:GAF domain-containing sensor histidine kinase [Promineifilum sp.]|uniref:GAF domain-containing sensor histidine kinase n=1 Tax=Promineifilum sp. TaxID=2664178 RepID=UPI0035B2699F